MKKNKNGYIKNEKSKIKKEVENYSFEKQNDMKEIKENKKIKNKDKIKNNSYLNIEDLKKENDKLYENMLKEKKSKKIELERKIENKNKRKKVNSIDEEELRRIEELNKIKKEYSNIRLKSVVPLGKINKKYVQGSTKEYIKEEESKKLYRNELYVIALIIFLTIAFVVGIIIWQANTVSKTNIKEIETLRDTELKAEINNTRMKNKELETKINELNSNIKEYENNNNVNSEKLIDEELKNTEIMLGYTDLVGEGIIITLEDNNRRKIDANDILYLINQLWVAGAEAISVNGKRIVSTSEVTLVNFEKIYVNTERLDGPYVVKAIGNKQELERVLANKNGYISEMLGNGKNVSYELYDHVKVPKYKNEIRIKYGE